ncbi:hypothetical protein MRX96_055748 [Rhipicephalus microplus]
MGILRRGERHDPSRAARDYRIQSEFVARRLPCAVVSQRTPQVGVRQHDAAVATRIDEPSPRATTPARLTRFEIFKRKTSAFILARCYFALRRRLWYTHEGGRFLSRGMRNEAIIKPDQPTDD